ncbi:MAG: CapA family protein [Planctomycetaceae bacterium]
MVATLFLCGDVMTGRGVDQVLPHPGDPTLHEPWVRDAGRYVELAEAAHGMITRPLEPAAVWGNALAELDAVRPAARIVNLETAITRSDDWCRDKEIHYRMHPANVRCLTAARIDVAAIANNHVLDWGETGLVETLDTLEAAGIRATGAGRDHAAARRPACVPLAGGGRVVVVACGSATSGMPQSWGATPTRPGVDLLPDLSPATARSVCERITAVRQPGDIAVVSIHWGTNWGHGVAEPFVDFAHALVDGGIDIVHGHSSHHVRPIEVYRNRLILYGCGDFIDDYEGIEGYEAFRPDLAVMVFPTVDATDRLVDLRLVPLQMRRFQLARVRGDDVVWLADTLTRTSGRFGCRAVVGCDDAITLRW